MTGRAGGSGDRHRILRAQLLLQLEHDPLRRLLADAGDGLEARRVLEHDRAPQLGSRRAGDDRQRHLRADPGDGEQVQEELPLGRVGEAVELERVLAHVQVGLDGRLAPALGRADRAGRGGEQVADAVDVEHEAVGRAADELAPEPRDHDSPCSPQPAIRRSGGASAWQIATASASAAWLGVGFDSSAEDRAHHPLHLCLLGAAVAAHRLLDAGRRVLDALDPDGCGGDEHGSARLPDGERGAGICPDERLFHCDGGGLVLRNERLHPLEDRLEAQFRALPRGRLPPPVVECPDTASAFLDDPVPASSRPWIDAQNLHEERLGGASDVPACRRRSGIRGSGSRSREDP